MLFGASHPATDAAPINSLRRHALWNVHHRRRTTVAKNLSGEWPCSARYFTSSSYGRRFHCPLAPFGSPCALPTTRSHPNRPRWQWRMKCGRSTWLSLPEMAGIPRQRPPCPRCLSVHTSQTVTDEHRDKFICVDCSQVWYLAKSPGGAPYRHAASPACIRCAFLSAAS